MSFGPTFWLAALGGAAAVAYGLYFLSRPPSLPRTLVKTLFMGAFTAALVAAKAPFPLVAAVAASACGDFFLAFDKKWVLPFGILSFLIAQLLYVVIFTAIWFFSGDNFPLLPRYIAVCVVGGSLLAFLVWFWRTDAFRRAPVSNSLAVACLIAVGLSLPLLVVWGFMGFMGEAEQRSPIDSLAPLAASTFAVIVLTIWRQKLGVVPLVAMIYAGVITAMGMAAMWLPWAGWPAMLGALSFLVSDFVLAAELFRLPADAPARRITAPVVWWTYVAAQVLIVWGVIRLVEAN